MQYILRRLLLVFPMLLGISLVTFIIVSLAPGDPITALIDPEEMNVMSEAELQRMREDLGLDEPIHVRYVLWLREAVQGNIGYSIHHRRPVIELILDRLPNSMILSFSSMAIAMTLGITLGVISALRQYTVLDYFLTGTAFFGLSVPVFFIALMGIFIFSVQLGWLPVFGMWTPGQTDGRFLDIVRHAILPVCALAVPQVALYMRYARASTLDALSGDYVTTARAKGLSEVSVLTVHVFRNSLIPLVTITGLSLPELISGSFIIETIFSWPGIGMLGYSAIIQRDYPLQLGIAMMAAIAVLLANLITDIVYAIVDPRIRYE